MGYRITTPARKWAGDVAGVTFKDGVNITPVTDKDVAALAYFQRKGYGVEDLDPQDTAPEDVPVDTPPAPEVPPAGGTDPDADPFAEETSTVPPPAGNGSVDEWRAWVVSTGRASEDEAGTLTRNELRERFGKGGES